MSATSPGPPRSGPSHAEIDSVEAYRALLRTSLRLRREVRKLFNRYGITGAQFGLLTRIPPGGITLTQLAETAWADPGNTSGVIDRLAREGWVTRTRSEEDRRVVYVCLSEKGAGLLRDLTPRYTEAVSRLMSPLSPDETAAFHHLLAKIESGLLHREQEVTENGNL